MAKKVVSLKCNECGKTLERFYKVGTRFLCPDCYRGKEKKKKSESLS